MSTRTKRRPFAPWYHERELALFEEESRSGWHLIRRTRSRMEYAYDPNIRYRYAMDYRAGHREDRYLEFFADDGWELVGTVSDPYELRADVTILYNLPPFRPHPTEGCWYIFRKKYDPTLPEEEYRISDEGELSEKRDSLARTYTRHGIGMALCLLIPILLALLWPVLRPLLLFLPYCATAAGIHFYRARSIRTSRGKLPRYGLDTGLKILATLLLVLACAGPCLKVIPEVNRIVREMTHSENLFRTELDPVDHLKNVAGLLEPGEDYEVFSTDTVTIVLTEDGGSFFYQKLSPEDTVWYDTMEDGIEIDGIYYTTPATFYGLYAHSCRLMGEDGTVYEPVYEAWFDGGCLPLFSLDVSQGQEYRCILYTVDETGQNRYDHYSSHYAGYGDWAQVYTSGSRQFTGSELLATPGGWAFAESFNDWRYAILATEPRSVEGSSPFKLGVTSTNQPFSTGYFYPPCLVLLNEEDSLGRPDPFPYWMSNQYGDCLSLDSEGNLYYSFVGNFCAEVEPLIWAETITDADLQKAAATILSTEEYYLSPIKSIFGGSRFGQTFVYPIELPQEPAALWKSVCTAAG